MTKIFFHAEYRVYEDNSEFDNIYKALKGIVTIHNASETKVAGAFEFSVYFVGPKRNDEDLSREIEVRGDFVAYRERLAY